MSQRSGFMRRESHVLADISEVDTLDSTTMTDQAVHNISAMFPTVEESHIKDLLKKYVFSLYMDFFEKSRIFLMILHVAKISVWL